MGYKLLGWVVWNGVKTILRQKYGRTMVPAPVLAAGIVAVALGVAGAVAAAKSGGDDS
jgi:hypothetical protein